MNKSSSELLMSSWSTVDGLRVHARRSEAPARPDRTPIVLVHGLSVSSRYMVPTAERLARYRQVYAPDLPGFGKSEHPREILTIPQLADALARWMSVVGLRRAAMLGNSMGCQIIADVAVRYPGLIEQAIMTGPTMDRRHRTMRAQAWRLLADMRREPISTIVTQMRDYWACGVRRTIGTMRAALADRIEAKLPAIDIPTLIVRGVRDPIAPQEWVEELVGLLPQGRLMVLAKAPHAVNYDAPGALARVVLDFLEANDRAPSKLEATRTIQTISSSSTKTEDRE